MNTTRRFAVSGLVLVGVLAMSAATAQTGGLADIEAQLTSTFHPAKATADGTDIVTAGSVLVLQKDHLLMCKIDQPIPIPNVYKGGVLSQNGMRQAITAISIFNKVGHFIPGVGAAAGAAGQAAAETGTNAAAATRDFVTGEKFWVTQITTKSDGAYFSLLTDAIDGQRYKATLQFPFAKGAVPAPDAVVALVSEVVTVDGGEQSADNSAAPSQQAPAPEPKTIAIGQTRDEVIAAFGVPTKVIKLAATREIDVFPDMKVTFVHDKVSNVE
jgi:hypothetical protein